MVEFDATRQENKIRYKDDIKSCYFYILQTHSKNDTIVILYSLDKHVATHKKKGSFFHLDMIDMT